MKIVELFEAMNIANVSMADAVQNGDFLNIDANIDGVPYQITFYPVSAETSERIGTHPDKSWAVEFKVIPEKRGKVQRKKIADDPSEAYKMQNLRKGIEFKLLPLVLGYIFDFLKFKKPDALMFSADKSEKSRVSVYNKILKRYEKHINALGYNLIELNKFDSHINDKHTAFVLVRKDLS